MIKAELERRPLVVACLGLILGLTLVQHPINLLFLLPAPWILSALSMRALLVGGLVIGTLLSPGPPPALLMRNQFVNSDWTISTLPKITPFGQQCEVEHRGVRLMLLFNGSSQLCPGSVLHITGVAQPPVEGMESYFQSRSLIGRIRTGEDSIHIVQEGPWIQRAGCGWRNRFLEFASKNLSPSAASATGALCFSADGLFDTSTREEMQRTGTTHIIAASGLQVLIVAQGLLALLSLVPIPRSLQLLAVALVLALYAVATGLHAPVVRAAVMWLIANAAYLFRREPDWLSALAASSILYLVWKPATVYEMGFQFSVIAVLFLALFSDRVKWKPGLEALLYRGMRRTFRSALLAFAVVTPLIAYHFGLVSLISVPANLVVVVAVAPVVVASMIALPLSFLWPAAGGLVMRTTLPAIDFIDSVMHSFGGERAAILFPPFSAYWLVPYYVLLLMLWRPHVRQP